MYSHADFSRMQKIDPERFKGITFYDLLLCFSGQNYDSKLLSTSLVVLQIVFGLSLRNFTLGAFLADFSCKM